MWEEAYEHIVNEERNADSERKWEERAQYDEHVIKGVVEVLNKDEYEEYLMAKGSTMKIEPMGHSEHEPTTYERAMAEDEQQADYERDDKIGAI